jgi:hypothetical protein
VESNLLPLPQSLLDDITESQKEFITDLVENPQATLGEGNFPQRFTPRLILNKDGTVSFGTNCEGNTKVLSRPSSIEGVFQLIKNVIDTEVAHFKPTWASKDANGQYSIPFVPHGVEKTSEVPTIVYRVLKGKPGAMGKGGPMQATNQQWRPIFRGTATDPNDADYEAMLFSWRKDYRIELCAVATTAHEANRVRSWLEDTLGMSLWYFRHSGIQQFLFEEQLADHYETHESVNLFYRPLKYYVAIDTLSWRSVAVLKKLVTTITLE